MKRYIHAKRTTKSNDDTENTLKGCLSSLEDSFTEDFCHVVYDTLNRWKSKHKVHFHHLDSEKRVNDPNKVILVENRAHSVIHKDTPLLKILVKLYKVDPSIVFSDKPEDIQKLMEIQDRLYCNMNPHSYQNYKVSQVLDLIDKKQTDLLSSNNLRHDMWALFEYNLQFLSEDTITKFIDTYSKDIGALPYSEITKVNDSVLLDSMTVGVLFDVIEDLRDKNQGNNTVSRTLDEVERFLTTYSQDTRDLLKSHYGDDYDESKILPVNR